MTTMNEDRARIDIDPGVEREARDAAGRFTPDFIERLAERVGARAGSEMVFGDPVERDGRTVIPVARSVWGTGGGQGESEEMGAGGGGGGGALSAPIGFIEIDAEGSRFQSLSEPWRDPRLVLAYGIAGWLILRTLMRLLGR